MEAKPGMQSPKDLVEKLEARVDSCEAKLLMLLEYVKGLRESNEIAWSDLAELGYVDNELADLMHFAK